MSNNRWVEPRAIVIGAVLCFAPQALLAQAGDRLLEPLPLDAAVSVRGHNSRSPINVSSDGHWIAHTVETDETVPRDTVGFAYSATGFSFAEGDARMEATLTHTRTGETRRLGAATSSSWAPVWSPVGGRVAFYSDEDGEAGLWVWDEETRGATRFPGVIVRPFFGFEGPRWSSDGERLLVKILPAGMTVAGANAREPRRTTSARFPDVEPDQPSVVVRRFDPDTAEADDPPKPGAGDAAGEPDTRAVDLAVLDLHTERITRLVKGAAVSYYAWSPDNRWVGYTIRKGSEPNSQQPIYDIVVHDVAGGESRTLVTDARLSYGIEWSWSPNSRAIAYISSGQLASGEIVIVSVDGGSVTGTTGADVPSFDPGDGEVAPLWSADGAQLYAVGDGQLWRVDAASGRVERVAAIDGWRIRALVSPFEQPTLWTTNRGRTAWVIASERDGGRAGIFAIDTATGESQAQLQESKSYSAIFNVTACQETGEIAYVSTDQQHLRDVWLVDTSTGQTRQATRLNEEIDRYPLGEARLIEWRGLDGEPLRGALLLPPGYRDGRVPLVVYVYGGAMGSTAVNRFGFNGGTPALNMHVLATRGYGVLYPDAPLGEGRTMRDIVATVMPGVNAAIDQGYADPDRLAVMGQSYGSFNTLSLITQTTRFKAAIITAAVLHPDLFADYLGSIGYYEQGQGNMGGSIWEQPNRYFDNSPLFRFDQIETPLLIGQGERDGDLVPANAIFSALERLEKPVEYRLYQGEGHVITRKPNVIDFWKRRLDFLAEHLDVVRDDRGAIVFDGNRARSRR